MKKFTTSGVKTSCILLKNSKRVNREKDAGGVKGELEVEEHKKIEEDGEETEKGLVTEQNRVEGF